MKERKIGEIFEYNGEWYQCVEDTEYISCINCCFYNGGHKLCTDKDIGNCVGEYRSDAKSICFKKLEKVGEPFYSKHLGKSYQRYKTYIPVAGSNSKIRVPLVEYVERNEIFIEIEQNKEDMEEKNNGNTPLNVLTDKYVNGDICYDDFEKEVKALYSCKEEIKPTLKEFDLEAAKAGKPVCTRDGRKARIICFDRRLFYKNVSYPILALVERSDGEDEVCTYNEKGRVLIEDDVEYKDDLMMLLEKKEGWVNVYKSSVYTLYILRFINQEKMLSVIIQQ